MVDISETLVAKSDQLTAADLIGSPMTVRILSVEVRQGEEQPVTIRLDGEERVYRPCKIMRRVLAQCWGTDSATWRGRSMTLYHDPDVMFGALKTGGIRVSHVSHIDDKIECAVVVKKGRMKAFRVLPLASATPPTDPAADSAADLVRRFDAIETAEQLAELEAHDGANKRRARLQETRPELSRDVEAAAMAAKARVGSVGA